MADVAHNILQTIGLVVVAGGGLSLIIYQIFKHLAAKWLDSKFDTNLQKLIHEQNKEIEKLRSSLTRTFDRVSKLHQREFEVLPEVWANTNEAYWSTRSLVSVVQTYPDLSQMEPAQLEEFIAKCELASWQKDQLRYATNKTDYYRENIYWHRSHLASQAIRKATVCLSQGSIFIRQDIKENVDNLIKLAWDAVSEEDTNHQHHPQPRLRDDINKLNSQGDKIFAALEQQIRERLYSPE